MDRKSIKNEINPAQIEESFKLIVQIEESFKLIVQIEESFKLIVQIEESSSTAQKSLYL